jgi:hypothetical protein
VEVERNNGGKEGDTQTPIRTRRQAEECKPRDEESGNNNSHQPNGKAGNRTRSEEVNHPIEQSRLALLFPFILVLNYIVCT